MTQDVWDAAEKAVEPPKVYFGQVQFDMWFCVLQKGIGKVPYDPKSHQQGQRRTAVDVSIMPLPSRGLDFTTERNLIAESRQWAGTVLPSIKALSTSAKALNGKWVQYEMVRTGRTWTGTDGELKHETVPKFLAVYDSEEAAEKAALKLFGGNGDSEPLPMEPGGNGDDPERAVAAKFLPALWAQAAEDVTAFMELVNGNPLTSKHFHLSSPEVIEIVSG